VGERSERVEERKLVSQSKGSLTGNTKQRKELKQQEQEKHESR